MEQQFGELNLSQDDHDQIFEHEDHQDRFVFFMMSFHIFCDVISIKNYLF